MPTMSEIRPALFAGPTDRQLSRRTASSTGPRAAERLVSADASSRAAPPVEERADESPRERGVSRDCCAMSGGTTVAAQRAARASQERAVRIIGDASEGWDRVFGARREARVRRLHCSQRPEIASEPETLVEARLSNYS